MSKSILTPAQESTYRPYKRLRMGKWSEASSGYRSRDGVYTSELGFAKVHQWQGGGGKHSNGIVVEVINRAGFSVTRWWNHEFGDCTIARLARVMLEQCA